MTHRIALIAIVAALMSLTGCKHMTMGGACHSPKLAYLHAQSVPPLKIPPGVDTPESTNALKIPALNTPVPPPRKKTDPCLDEPPPFNAPKQAPPQA